MVVSFVLFENANKNGASFKQFVCFYFTLE